jgi:formylglycine-generating enzyme required for sulfatase activity
MKRIVSANITYLLKLNGNTPAELGQQPDITLRITNMNLWITHGCDINSGSETHPVGQKKPNVWGLYDINGNVWEWCQDNWHDNYNGAPSDGSTWESESDSSRVVWGGNWINGNMLCRSACRYEFEPDERYNSLGFCLWREI